MRERAQVTCGLTETHDDTRSELCPRKQHRSLSLKLGSPSCSMSSRRCLSGCAMKGADRRMCASPRARFAIRSGMRCGGPRNTRFPLAQPSPAHHGNGCRHERGRSPSDYALIPNGSALPDTLQHQQDVQLLGLGQPPHLVGGPWSQWPQFGFNQFRLGMLPQFAQNPQFAGLGAPFWAALQQAQLMRNAQPLTSNAAGVSMR